MTDIVLPAPETSPDIEFHIDGEELIVNLVMRLSADVREMDLGDEGRELWKRLDPVANDYPPAIYRLLLDIFTSTMPADVIDAAWKATEAELQRRADG
jgi:hypothetical protein